MKLIFIRHAEPDYKTDSLTEKGEREANLLSKRTRNWSVTQFYSSPLGRAQKTALPTLNCHNVTLTNQYPDIPTNKLIVPDSSKAIVYPWLREVNSPVNPNMHPVNATVPWDFTPEFLNQYPLLFDMYNWDKVPIIEQSNMRKQYDYITNGLDNVLNQFGYKREGLYYRTTQTKKSSNFYMEYDGNTLEHLKKSESNETVIVIFCHLGVMLTMMSHLMNTSPFTLLHGIFVPPSSVTVFSAEERFIGNAYFRAQMIGDTSHLKMENEPISYYGSFATPFQL